MSHLHDLVEGSSKITSSMTGVDYNNDDDHEDDDTMPSFLFLDPQEFIRSSSKAISIFGADDKTKSGLSKMLQYLLLVASMYVRL